MRKQSSWVIYYTKEVIVESSWVIYYTKEVIVAVIVQTHATFFPKNALTFSDKNDFFRRMDNSARQKSKKVTIKMQRRKLRLIIHVPEKQQRH